MSDREFYTFVIALVVIVGVFVLIALDKISWEVGAPIISAIIFFYFGVKAGRFIEAGRKRK